MRPIKRVNKGNVIQLLLAVVLACGSSLLHAQVVVANFSATPLIVCPGQTVQFTDLSTGSPSSWLWTFPGGSPATSTLQHPVITYNSPGSYNVSLAASNGGLPSVVTTFSYITVNSAPPPPGIISGPVTLCAGNIATYSVTQGSGVISYSWSAPSNATVISGQGSNSFSLRAAPGIATLCVRGGNNCGYGLPSCMVLTGIFAPAIAVSPASSTICAGQSVTLSASGAAAYTWTPSNGLSTGITGTVVASPSISTAYTVTGVASSGCSNSAVSVVNVATLPLITVTPASTVICQGQSVSIAATGAQSYSWSPPSGLNTTSGSSVIASPSTSMQYTVIGKGANGCAGSATAAVSVTTTPPGPPPLIIGPPVVCAGLSSSYSVVPMNNASLYSWSVTSPATIVSGQGSPTVTVQAGTTASSLCVRAGNGCGFGAQFCSLLVPLAQPVIAVTPSAATICSGSGVTITATGASAYSWTPSDGLSSTTGPVAGASPTITTSYTVTGTDLSGCTGTSSVLVTVQPSPTISVSPDKPSVCQGGSVTLTASGAQSYTWSPPGTLSSSSSATVVATPPVTTSYTLTGSSANGCQNSVAITVTVTNTTPVATIPQGPVQTCAGTVETYSVAPFINASGYSWSVPSGAVILSGQGTTLVTVQVNASGNICVSGVNGCGTGIPSCLLINALPVPALVVTPSAATLCVGDFVSLQASGASGYSWSPSQSLSSATSSAVFAGPQTSTIYTVTGTAVNGCTAQAGATVSVNELPVITAAPSSTAICNGNTVALQAAGGVSYTWSPSASLSAASGSMVTASPTVSTVYTIASTGTNGCTGFAESFVRVDNAPPAPSSPVSGSDILCERSTVTFSVLPQNDAGGFIWSAPGTSSVLTGQGTEIASVLIVNGGSVCVTPFNGCGNGTSSCLNLTVHPLPSITAVATGTACQGGTVTLTASGGISYTWSPAQGLSGTSGATVSANQTNTYIVSGSSGEGCVNSASVAANISDVPLQPKILGPLDVCPKGNTQFAVITNPALSYTWTVTGGLEISAQTNTIVNITVTAPGTICAATGNACGLSPVGCRSVGMRAIAGVTLEGHPDIDCIKPVTELAALTTSNAITVWQAPGNINMPGERINVMSGGTYTATVTHFTSACSITATINVTQHTHVLPYSLAAIPSTCGEYVNNNDGQVIMLSHAQGQKYAITPGPFYGGGDNYASAANALRNKVLVSNIKNDPQGQAYTVRIFDNRGCYADSTVIVPFVKCEHSLFIPDVFTPDGEGTNDRFVISNLPEGVSNNLTVYNRWGNKVFSEDNYDNRWDGTSNTGAGGKLPAGTYYYVLEIGTSTMKGFILIQY